MITQVDPVAIGFVASMARPGSNITGIATLQRDLSGKRLELLSEVVPRLARMLFLFSAIPSSMLIESKLSISQQNIGFQQRMADRSLSKRAGSCTTALTITTWPTAPRRLSTRF
jgi:ABC-type uncharacterized transport system substrate-binding protein